MKPISKGILSRLAQSLRRRGLPGTWRRVSRSARTSYREWRLGIRTTGSIDARLLNHDVANFGYQPIPYDSLDAVFQHIDITDGQAVFLDYGCGMGRALVQAALRPFRRVVGVELSAELCAIAKENLARARAKLVCRDISIVEADAGGYAVPDDVTVVFMFNPFDVPVVRAVLLQLRDSLRRKPRRLSIIYGLPTRRHGLPKRRRDLLAETEWLPVGREVQTIDSGLRLVVYEYSPAGPLNRK